jgi:hypothetical protein
MRSPWILVRCSLLKEHRWETIRIGTEKGKECRDCGARSFDTPENATLHRIKGGLPGSGVGGGFSL